MVANAATTAPGLKTLILGNIMNPSQLPKRKRLRYLKTLAIFIILPFLGYSCKAYISPKYETNASTARWMPEGASNGAHFEYGSFIISSPVFYFEYDILEKNFIEDMHSRSLQPLPIKEPQRIDRYLKAFIRYEDYKTETGFLVRYEFKTGTGLSVRYEDYKAGTDLSEGTIVNDYDAYYRAVQAKVSNGLYYYEQLEPDASLHYVYDRDRGRAYICNRTR